MNPPAANNNLEALFAAALEALQRADVQSALSSFNAVLAIDPRHGMSNYWLGCLLKNVSVERALPHLEIAVARHPDMPDCHIEIALAWQALGNADRTEQAFAMARQIAPEYGAAQMQIAQNLLKQNRPDEAIQACERGLILFPRDAALLRKLADLYLRQNHWPAALTAWKRLLEVTPNCERTHLAFGQICFGRREFELAEGAFSRVLELKPDLLVALVNLGLVRQKLGRFAEAVDCLNAALGVAPEQPQIHKALGDVYRDLHEWVEAERAWRRAVELDPDYADAWQNLGLGLERLNRLEEALACHERVIQLQPSNATAHRYLGMVCQDLQRLDRAACEYAEALRLAPNDAESHWQLFSLMATQGRFPEAWIEHEWRWTLAGRTTPKREFPQPKWDGSELNGRRILLHAEQGFGDTIQALRYVPLVRARGGIVLLWVPPELVGLAQRIPGVAQAFSQLATNTEFDVHLPMMSLPHVFSSTLDTIPARVPYLDAPLPGLASHVDSSVRLKVGLVWAGSGSQPNDRRPVPFPELLPLLGIEGIDFYSLQIGPAADDLKRFDPGSIVRDCSASLTDFAATAAVVRQLDLVISIDTSVAHLAGALGKPTWLLTAFAPDWRWMRDRADNPWYPTMRLFRQMRPGEWRPVIAQVGQALASLAVESLNIGTSARACLGCALVHHQAGRLAEAEFWYLKALAMQPDQADLLRLLGVISRERGNLSGALGWLEQAADRDPTSALVEHDLGLARLATGKSDQAIAAFRRAVEIDPQFADAHYNLGNAYYAQKQLGPAKAAFQRALALNGNMSEAHYNLGLIAQVENAVDIAVAHYRQAVSIAPNNIRAWQNLGVALKDLDALEEAEQCLRIVLDMDPERREARVNLASVLCATHDRLDEAERLCRSVIASDANVAEAWLNLGVIQQQKGDVPGAISSFCQARTLQPENADAEFNLGIAKLLSGQFAEGWEHYEARWRTRNPIFKRDFPPVPRWGGEEIRGRTIVVHAEQGYGDTIQFIRYVPLLAARGAVIAVECPEPLVRLLRCVDGVRHWIRLGNSWPEADFRTPLMSLPLLLGPDTIPTKVPYLRTPDDVRLPLTRSAGAFSVGIVWAGSAAHGNDRRRSILPSELRTLLQVGGVEFYGFQIGRPDEARTLLGKATRFSDVSPMLSDFACTAAAIQQMDLVISVDTAVAHLAGALGKPVWVLLPFAPDWRWQLNREDSPWYPTMRLIRQNSSRTWSDVMERTAIELGKLRETKRGLKH